MNKKLLLPILLAVVVSFFPTTTNATSAWDAAYQTTNNLVISDNPGYWSDCVDQDIQPTWAQYILNESYWKTSGSSSAMNLTNHEEVRDNFTNALHNGSWSVVYQPYLWNNGGGSVTAGYYVTVVWSEAAGANLEWLTDGSGRKYVNYKPPTGSYLESITIATFEGTSHAAPGTDCVVRLESRQQNLSGAVISREGGNLAIDVTVPYATYLSSYQGLRNYLTNGKLNFNYPAGYEGAEVRVASPTSTKLTPDYSWKVSESGELNVSYLKNLEHFLTGTSWVNVIKMTEDWEDIDETLEVITSQPAGWLNENYTLPAGEGWYMIRIDHDQQIDSPPWPADTEYYVYQRWIQIYWDGHTAIQGNTVGCASSELCNPYRDETGMFDGITFDNYGLQAIVTAPLTFLGTLPAKVSSCSGVALPNSPFTQSLTLPCLKSTYQTYFPTVLTVWQTVMTGVAAYYVGTKIFATIKDIQNPHHDRIEVMQL